MAALAWLVVWVLVGLIIGILWMLSTVGQQKPAVTAHPLGPGWWNPLRFALGLDGSPSTSKLQLLLWTMVVTYGFLTVAVARFAIGKDLTDVQFDSRLLLILGYSVTGAVAAAGITATQVQNGTVTKPTPPNAGASAFVQSDDGSPDLGKIQLLAWNFIAMGVFLYLLIWGSTAISQDPQLPKLDDVLMVLVGLSGAAYLGHKLVATTTPRLFGDKVAPSLTPPIGSTVIIQGAALGTNGTGSTLLLDGDPINQINWNDSQISFTVPGYRSDNAAPWDGGDHGPGGKPAPKLNITGWVGGQTIAGDVSIRLPAPLIASVTGGPLGPGGKPVTITGSYFGLPGRSGSGDNQVLLVNGADKQPVKPELVTWATTSIIVTPPVGPPRPGSSTTYKVSVVSYGRESAPSNDSVMATMPPAEASRSDTLVSTVPGPTRAAWEAASAGG